MNYLYKIARLRNLRQVTENYVWYIYLFQNKTKNTCIYFPFGI